MLRDVLLSAAVGVPLVLAFLALDTIQPLHSLPLLLIVLAIAMWAAEELTNLLRNRGFKIPPSLGMMAAAIPVLVMFCYRRDPPQWLLLLITLGLVFDILLIALALIADLAKRKLSTLVNFLLGCGAGLVIGILLGYLFLLRLLPMGIWAVVLAFMAAWISDAAGFLIGRKWGRRKLVPRISPGKTVEGSGAALLATLTVFAFFPIFTDGHHMLLADKLLLGVVIGVVAQVGDLAESRVKRFCQVKDSGSFIPGYGGILDIFDSLLLVAPVLYYLLSIV